MRIKYKQTAVYWPSPTADGYGGYDYGTAVEIDCRWEWRQKVILDRAGKEKISRAVVYVKQDLDLQGFLYLGSLDDLTTEQRSDPMKVDDAFEIIEFKKIPGINAKQHLRAAYV